MMNRKKCKTNFSTKSRLNNESVSNFFNKDKNLVFPNN